MKLLVIGGSRGIGRQLVEQALQAGHEVTVLARDPRRLAPHERLRSMPGDVLDADAVRRAMAGQQAVCLSLGIPPTWKPVTVFSQGTANTLQAMGEAGVRRLVCVTGIGAGDSKGHGGFLYDRIAQPLLLRTIYQDKDRQEALIKASGLDWVIVRPGFLTNGPLTGRYRVLTDLTGVTAGRISRADVAHFLLQALASDRYLGQTPLLTQ
ncbi:NAD(P)-dependent oxidoreductase [Candidatus Methylocalor cossyra]|uniref:Flavin reductase n=1 Tax=Candidatus Methylocalor cossyra TaxID=3108543 RepID=A0ABP1C605_9GAMM